MHNLHPFPDPVKKTPNLNVSYIGFFKTEQKSNFALFWAPLQCSGKSMCHKPIDVKAFRYHHSQHCGNILYFPVFLIQA